MYRTILVPLDGSLIAERVLPFVQTLARASGGRIVLVRAALESPSDGTDSAEERRAAMRESEEYLQMTAAQLDADVDVETAAYYGEAAEVILQQARERNVDLVVMSTHGRSGLGRWIYGSVADRVMRHAEVPVMLIPAGCECVWPTERAFRILVPLDGSDFAEEALRPARDLARMLSAELYLLRVVEPSSYARLGGYPYLVFDPEADLAAARRYLEGIAGRLRSEGLAVEVRSVIGPPALMIATLAREQHANAVVIATHGTGGLSRLVMGSVATGLFQRSTVPIVIVRPSAIRQASSLPEVIDAEERYNGPPISLVVTPLELNLLEDGLEKLLESRDHEQSETDVRRLLSRIQKTEAPAYAASP